MRSKIYIYLMFICSGFLLISNVTLGQKVEMEIFLREIRIMHEDSVVFAQIKDKTDEIKIDDTKMYYWYSKDKIYKNRGGVHGKVLHGSYRVVDKKGQLISEGIYVNGLKSGIWKKWTRLGELESIREWQDGMLNGKATDYNYKGNIERIKYFKKGKLHGKYITYVKGIPVEKVFKNGEEIEKKQAKTKPVKGKLNENKKETKNDKLNNINEKKKKSSESKNTEKVKKNKKEKQPKKKEEKKKELPKKSKSQKDA